MDYTEFSVLPPEYVPKPELEYDAQRTPEQPPLPPEFGQTGQAAEPAAKKRRGLRELLAIPAILLLVFLFTHPLNAASTPSKPAAPVPAQSAEPVPALPDGNSVGFTLSYVVRDADEVRYSYAVYWTDPDGSANWPVSVYARLTDENGNTAAPEYDPDVWESSRALFEYSIPSAGLEGELTWTLTAVYTENGQERQTTMTLPLSDAETLPAEPTLSGTLEVFPGGDVDAVFRFVPAPDDPHEYQLRVIHAGQEEHGGEDGIMGLSLVDDPGAMEVTGDKQNGYEVHYSGGSAAAMIPEGTQLLLYITLVDDADGKQYTIATNLVDAVERVSGYETYPLTDGKLVITVYNDTMAADVPSPVPVEDDPRTILFVDAMPESDFTEFALPSALAPEGFSFAGWAVHVHNPLDFDSDVDLFVYGGDPPVDVLIAPDSYVFPVSGTLTKEDVERVPPSDDGIRYVNVHAVWIEDDPETVQLYLDDGFGNVTGYGQNSPIYSEGFLYLCNYPVPEHEGLVFDGWYDENGSRVDMLVSYFSFTPMVCNADGSFAGYDWANKGAVTLTAHWKPG